MVTKIIPNRDILPELLFVTPGDNTQRQQLLRLSRQGQIKRIYPSVYTSNLRTSVESIVNRNWSAVLSYLAPGAVVSHRSAFDARPEAGVVYYSRAEGTKKPIELPGLTAKGLIGVSKGAILTAKRRGANDIAYGGLYIASQARAFLENLTKDKRLLDRQLPRMEIENRLERILSLRGEYGLNELRDDAREAAQICGLFTEFAELEKIIGALLGTHSSTKLTSTQALARAKGKAYDAQRLTLFETLAGNLRHYPFADIEEPAQTGDARILFAFIESYFSNYIEGTTFTVEEAEDIVFHGKIISRRTADSNDVKGTFDAALRDPFYSQPPQDTDTFIQWIKNANAKVMSARFDKHPGEWKEQANQAGTTLFVMPELVEGTLREAWPFIATLTHPMQRALMAMFLVVEVHPFGDGNGRTARLLMNSFLSAEKQCRIIVPTIYREDYLLPLKALSHHADSSSFIRAMRLCQAWTAELNYSGGLLTLNAQLRQSNAKKEDITENRLLSPLTGLPMRVPE